MEPTVISLWPGAAPGSEAAPQTARPQMASTYPEREVTNPRDIRLILNVTRPTVTVCLPDPVIATGAGVVVCPGGAFHVPAIDHEGLEVAAWLNAHGIAAFVLKYRINHTGDDYQADIDANLGDPARMEALTATLGPMIVADGQQAIRLVRRHTVEWGAAPDRVGIMGFSAGGAPPAEVWKAAGLPVELHIYAQGGHGFGMRPQGLPCDTWIERFADRLKMLGMLNRG